MKNPQQQNIRDVLKIRYWLLILALFSLVCSIYPEWRFWSVDSLRSYPVVVRVILVALISISLIPPVSLWLGSVITNLFEGLKGYKANLCLICLVALLTLGFVVLSSDNHILGDGYYLLGKIPTKAMGAFEPLEHWFHQALTLVTGDDEYGILWSYRLSAYLAGVLFFLGLRYFIRSLPEFLLASAALLGFGVMQFFFGYVENYTYSLLMMFFYLLSARDDLVKRRISLRTLIFLALAIGFHLASAAIIPSVLYLIHNRFRSWRITGSSILVTVIVFSVAVVYATSYKSLDRILLPLLPTTNNPYGILTKEHFFDLFNVTLLSYPLVFITIPLLLLRRVQFAGFYLIACVCLLLFTVVIDPMLGALRDWDLLSFAAAPIMVSVVSLLSVSHRIDSVQISRLLMPLLLFAVLHTGSWVWQNYDSQKSWNYIKDVVLEDPHLSIDYYESGQFTMWIQVVRDIKADTLETQKVIDKWCQMLSQSIPQLDYERSRYILAMQYLYINDYQRAANLIRGHEDELADDLETVRDRGHILKKAGYLAETEKLYESYLAAGGTDYHVYYSLASLISEAALSTSISKGFLYVG